MLDIQPLAREGRESRPSGQLAAAGYRVTRPPFSWVAVVFTLAYVACYLAYPSLPGNSPHLEGWWGWFDQGQYLKSVKALASGKLDPEFHWYPMGYALLATPFYRMMPVHPYFLPNLALLLTSVWLYLAIVAELELNRLAGFAMLVLCVLASPLVFQQHVIPWTTTPAMTVLLWVSYLYVRSINCGLTLSRAACLGIAASLMLMTRPTDILALVPVYVHLLLKDAFGAIRSRALKPFLPKIAAAAMGAGLVAAAALALHVAIYGWAPSSYMAHSSRFGLDFHLIPFRFYVIFISPAAFYGEGQGIIVRFPLIVFGLAALVYCLAFWHRYAGLPAMVLVYIMIYLSYPDLLPSGLWRFMAFHYYKWVFPMLGLLALVAARDVWRSWSIAKIALPSLLIAFALAIEYRSNAVPGGPTSAGSDQLAVTLKKPEMIIGARIAGVLGSFEDVYFGWDHVVEIDGHKLRNIFDLRMVPIGDTIFLVFNRPVEAQSVAILFKPGLRMAPDANIVPRKGKFSLRSVDDWH